MATNARPMLHLELTSGIDMNFKLRGSGPEISALIATAMNNSPEAAAIFLTAVMLYCNKKDISLANLDGISNATL